MSGGEGSSRGNPSGEQMVSQQFDQVSTILGHGTESGKANGSGELDLGLMDQNFGSITGATDNLVSLRISVNPPPSNGVAGMVHENHNLVEDGEIKDGFENPGFEGELDDFVEFDENMEFDMDDEFGDENPYEEEWARLDLDLISGHNGEDQMYLDLGAQDDGQNLVEVDTQLDLEENISRSDQNDLQSAKAMGEKQEVKKKNGKAPMGLNGVNSKKHNVVVLASPRRKAPPKFGVVSKS